jgi:hypothetical protein
MLRTFRLLRRLKYEKTTRDARPLILGATRKASGTLGSSVRLTDYAIVEWTKEELIRPAIYSHVGGVAFHEAVGI